MTVKNQTFGWKHRGQTGEVRSPYLYALDGKIDNEGSENYTIYAAFNRTIRSASREGRGVGKVIITLKGAPVPTVTSATGQVWMDRNLGASRVAQSINDEEAFGDLYQWGRGTDGHEKRDSGTTSELSFNDNPSHGNFIHVPSAATTLS